MQTLGYTSPTVQAAAERIDRGHRSRSEETIAEEIPVTFAYNGASHAVMMATPADLEDFATGFSLTEGLVERASDVTRVGVVRYSRGVELQIETRLPIGEPERRRRLAGRTGCGICGMDDVDALLRALPTVQSAQRISAAAISRAMRELAERQPLNHSTGAVHGAAFATAAGEVQLVREDVGRHNALDKLAGALARGGTDATRGFVVMTSRGSFELVQKCAIIGAPLLATVSAPTGLAIRVATDAGITLAGFARDERVTLYSHGERVETAS
jgi:FdhD protein